MVRPAAVSLRLRRTRSRRQVERYVSPVTALCSGSINDFAENGFVDRRGIRNHAQRANGWVVVAGDEDDGTETFASLYVAEDRYLNIAQVDVRMTHITLSESS